jgi:hypothetical protein
VAGPRNRVLRTHTRTRAGYRAGSRSSRISGGQSSGVFHVLSELGQEETNGRKSLECAHTFDLGDRYSKASG